MRKKQRREKGYRSQIRQHVWERDGHRCAYCSRPLHRASMSIDHEMPLANGGDDDLHNMVLSCPRCNALKGDKSLDEFRERMKWQLGDMPYFSPDQIQYLQKWHGITLEPRDTRFWAERRIDGDPPMIRPGEEYDYDGAKRRLRNKERKRG